jgi:2-methylcitrate dehydratase
VQNAVSNFLRDSFKMDATTKKLTDFTTGIRFSDLTPLAVQSAKARIISTCAASLAALDMEPVRIVRSLAQPPAAGPAASILGTLAKTTPDMAAFVNSAMVRCLDLSDTSVMAAVSHPADAFPAILAVAEAEGANGQDLLLAMAIIYEVQCRFVEVVPYNHGGWDQTTIVALGAALGCGRLLRLNEEQMRHAIAIAIVPNISLNQTRTGKLSMWKGMAGPQGARAGVHAAYLARAGMTGPDDVFEGKFGFWKQIMGGEKYDVRMPTNFKDYTFGLQQTMIKSFPTRFNCQVPVFAAQKLRGMVDHTAIASLRIESIRQAFDRWMNVPEIWKPETRETADHSLPCTVAMGLIDGTITPKMMDEGRFKAPEVLELMSKCAIELPDEFAELAPETRCCRLTAKLKDGRTVVADYRRSLADDIADSGWAQAVDKLDALTRDRLDAEARRQLCCCVAALERETKVDRLVAGTRVNKA